MSQKRLRNVYFMPRRSHGRHDSLNAAINWSWCHSASLHVHTDAVTLVLCRDAHQWRSSGAITS